VKTLLSFKIFTLNEANTCSVLPNACRHSVLALSYSVITTKIDHQSTVVKTVEQTVVVCHVAEPKFPSLTIVLTRNLLSSSFH
jgi:hypothetical protein